MSLVPILTVIFIVTISLLVTKIAAAMLVNTGLSIHSAKFQSRSAFTGVGFTTSESEQITTHPVRRKIVASLMLLGNAGIVTVMASLLLTFVHKDEKGLPWYYGVAVLVGAVIILTIVASSNKVDAALTKLINKVLGKFKSFSMRDYGSLYKLADDYHISDLYVREGGWLDGKKPSDARFQQDGIIVLGIEKPDGTYIGTIPPDTVFQKNDLLIVYGREHAMKLLDPRKSKSPGDKHKAT
ncbi:MAG: TrkA C-terminal domain-containing protein [Bacteroidales bacterium]|nr:TrkA C-terminal domain-containing protein [Bacteroidales bacterium]